MVSEVAYSRRSPLVPAQHSLPVFLAPDFLSPCAIQLTSSVLNPRYRRLAPVPGIRRLLPELETRPQASSPRFLRLAHVPASSPRPQRSTLVSCILYSLLAHDIP